MAMRRNVVRFRRLSAKMKVGNRGNVSLQTALLGFSILVSVWLLLAQSRKIQSVQEMDLLSPPSNKKFPSIESWPPRAQLEELLANDKNKRLVVAAANYGYVDFASNYANSLLRLGITNFVLVPLDGQAEQLLKKAYPQHTLPLMPGLPNKHTDGLRWNQKILRAVVSMGLSVIGGDTNSVYSHRYGSEEFKLLTASRPTILQAFLKAGYTTFYNDIDMVWRRNAWNVLDRILEEQQNDNTTTTVETLLWRDGQREICSCLLYLPPVAVNMDILNVWKEEILSEQHNNDQPAFNKALQRQKYVSLVSLNSTHERIRVVPNSMEFPHGKMYFGENSNNATLKDTVVIVHNNWVRGKQPKRQRWEEAGLWNPSGKFLS